MTLNNLIDLHTHTNISPDGVNTPEEMCERAIELGLSAYAITDHCEVSTWFDEEYYDKIGARKSDDPFVKYNYRDRFFTGIDYISRLKEKYDGRLNLLCGIELGQATQGWDGAEEVAACKKLDFIIGSLHQNRGEDDFGYLQYDNNNILQINKLLYDYFNEMLEMCIWGKFDTLGHLTYPLRYISASGIDIEMKPYEDMIIKIFTTLIEKGKGIEINTSGLRQAYGKTFPDLYYVKLFRNLGGEILTLGSDSHCIADLGKGIFNGAEIAKEAGFRYITYFKNRKPEFIRL